MRFGNREKIVIGTILGLATIGALHVLVFKPRAHRLFDERQQYENQKSQIEALGKTKSLDTINKFQLQNADFMLQFYNLMDQLNLVIPPQYYSDPDEERQKRDMEDWLQQVRDKQQPEAKPKLTFLDDDHWSLPQSLPDEVTQTGVDLGDRVRKVIDADEVIKVLPEGHPLRLQQEIEYKRLLKDIGVDLDKANNGLPQFGPSITSFYLLVRAQLIRDALPKDFNLKTPLRELFRLKWPEQILIPVKQLQALNDIIEMASQAGVEEIVSVAFNDAMAIYPPPGEAEQQVATAQTTGAPMGPGMAYPGMAYPGMAMPPGAYPTSPMGPEMMYPGGPAGAPMGPPGAMPGEPGMYEPGMYPGMMYPGMYPGMPGMPGMGAGATKVPTIEAVGGAAPIQMELIGPNLNVMRFLYAVTHSKRTYGIRYLAIKSMDEPSGWIRVITTINLVVTTGSQQFTPAQIQDKIAEWQQVKEEMEKKLGVTGQAGTALSTTQPPPAEKPI